MATTTRNSSGPTEFVVIDYEPKSVTVKPGGSFTVKFSRIVWDRPLPRSGVLSVAAFIGEVVIGATYRVVKEGSVEYRDLTLKCVVPKNYYGKYTVKVVIRLTWRE